MDEARLAIQGGLMQFFPDEWYRVGVETAVVAVLSYIAVIDFRSFKIQNWSVLLLLALYVLYAPMARSSSEIIWDVVLGIAMFAVLLWFYAKGAVGGGDVKLVPLVCLWVGTHCALLFSILLLAFISVHLIATHAGRAGTVSMAGRRAIPYGPAVAAALICTILLGCL